MLVRRTIGGTGRRFRRFALLIALVAGPLAFRPCAGADEYLGIPAGFTADGDAYLGRSDAPITLEDWSDYQCPFCGRHFRQTLPALLAQHVRPGKVRLVFRDYPLAELHPTSMAGHIAARCVGRMGAEKYWAMHDALFERQAEWAQLPDPRDFLTTLAVSLGAEKPAFAACLGGKDARAAVTASVAEANRRGYSSTPTFRFRWDADRRTHDRAGAYPIARFNEIFAAILAGKDVPSEAPPEPAALPLWARPEGQAPDPARPGYTLTGDAFKGNPNARVTVVEFGDFQCPACAKHVLDVQPKIDAALVATGKVRWISKHLPLKSHPQAALAAAAAVCGGEQKKYWEMHDALYKRQGDWATGAAPTVLPKIARDIGLDGSAFDRCFNGRTALEHVLADLYDAQGIVERAPSFVILPGDGTGSISGGMAADGFIKFLTALLEGGKPAPPK
jgi:protein-disulfide isomerase